MLAKVNSSAVVGLDAVPVEVEVLRRAVIPQHLEYTPSLLDFQLINVHI